MRQYSLSLDCHRPRAESKTDASTFYLGYADSLERNLVGFIRILLNDAEWEKYKKKNKLPKGNVDAQVHSVLSSVIEERKAKYPSSLSSDLSALVKGEIADENVRRATIVRVGELRLLCAAQRVARELVDGDGGGEGERANKREAEGDADGMDIDGEGSAKRHKA